MDQKPWCYDNNYLAIIENGCFCSCSRKWSFFNLDHTHQFSDEGDEKGKCKLEAINRNTTFAFGRQQKENWNITAGKTPCWFARENGTLKQHNHQNFISTVCGKIN